jgi:ATP-binding protein involved in chromosome partitioning
MSMDLLLPSDETPVTWDAPTQSDAYTWRGTMEANTLREFLTDTVWGPLDYLIIDLPPGTDRLPTVTGLLEVSGSIIVTIPSEVSQLVVKKSIAMARQTGSPILGLLENMAGYVCPRCGKLGELFGAGQAERMASDFGIPFLGAIPFDPRLAHAADRGVPFVTEHPESPAALALGVLAGKVRERLSHGT